MLFAFLFYYIIILYFYTILIFLTTVVFPVPTAPRGEALLCTGCLLLITIKFFTSFTQIIFEKIICIFICDAGDMFQTSWDRGNKIL